MSMVEWAKRELELIGDSNDEMQKLMNENVLEIIKVFSEQGHSGFSANYALGLVKRLLAYKPITPLTGEDEEWNDLIEYGDFRTQQNKRCSTVFRRLNDDGTFFTYDIGERIFTRDNGKTWFRRGGDRKEITFPYTVPAEPERIYLKE